MRNRTALETAASGAQLFRCLGVYFGLILLALSALVTASAQKVLVNEFNYILGIEARIAIFGIGIWLARQFILTPKHNDSKLLRLGMVALIPIIVVGAVFFLPSTAVAMIIWFKVLAVMIGLPLFYWLAGWPESHAMLSKLYQDNRAYLHHQEEASQVQEPTTAPFTGEYINAQPVTEPRHCSPTCAAEGHGHQPTEYTQEHGTSHDPIPDATSTPI